ncbi:hypothetical protein [Haloimpatiens lingqiaonensis]|nr:hypothetical protein [Haloimpatiens lingqiaonensis]
MQDIGGSIMALSFLGIVKSILEVLLYISAIIVLFKVTQALNIYINKNSR